MEKQLGYKKLLIPSAIYAALGSLQIYLGEVLIVSGEIDAAKNGIDAIFSNYTFFAALLLSFNFLGGFTLVFWAICFLKYRKRNINLDSPKTWIVPGISVCFYSFIRNVLAVNENFVPCMRIEFHPLGLVLYIQDLMFQAIPFSVLLILYVCIPKRKNVKGGE